MAVINAFGVLTIIAAAQVQSWIILVGMLVILIVADIVYFTKRSVPLKYLLPGLIFLLVFQVFIFGYTAYIAFTNYGTGHVGTQEQAVEAALIQGERRVEDSPTYPLAVVERAGVLGFAITDEGEVKVGSAEQPLEVVAQTGDAGAPTDVPGWTIVPRNELISDQETQAEV